MILNRGFVKKKIDIEQGQSFHAFVHCLNCEQQMHNFFGLWTISMHQILIPYSPCGQQILKHRCIHLLVISSWVYTDTSEIVDLHMPRQWWWYYPRQINLHLNHSPNWLYICTKVLKFFSGGNLTQYTGCILIRMQLLSRCTS